MRWDLFGGGFGMRWDLFRGGFVMRWDCGGRSSRDDGKIWEMEEGLGDDGVV